MTNEAIQSRQRRESNKPQRLEGSQAEGLRQHVKNDSQTRLI
jgi:hypothetical protein